MKVTATALPEVLLLEPSVFGDARGFFLESFNQSEFDKAVGQQTIFVQDNHSRSSRRVLRGLHYQLPPHAQGKLVRVTNGKVLDVAVDIRRSSPRFGRWVAVELDAESHRQLWIPAGFAHGFMVLSDSADFLYKTTGYYAPQSEASISWNDPRLGISWPLENRGPIVSGKDALAPLLADAACYE